MSGTPCFLWVACALFGLAGAEANASDGDWVVVPFDAAQWELEGEGTTPATYLGQPALRTRTGDAARRRPGDRLDRIRRRLPGRAGLRRGVLPRRRRQQRQQLLTARAQERRWDRTSTCRFQGHATWQIYSGAGHGSRETYAIGGWNHIRLEVHDDAAGVFVNGTATSPGSTSTTPCCSKAVTGSTRDPGFLGIVGLHQSVAVPLVAGRNDIAFVVEETSGGWAAEAQFVDASALHSAAFEAPRRR